MTSEERKLQSEISRANRLIIIFATVAVVVSLIVLFRLISYSNMPEGGFAGMLLMFQWFLWAPLIVFPVIGGFMAFSRRQRLTERLRNVEKRSDDHVP
jgi:hypothetical protein